MITMARFDVVLGFYVSRMTAPGWRALHQGIYGQLPGLGSRPPNGTLAAPQVLTALPPMATFFDSQQLLKIHVLLPLPCLS